VLQTVTIDPVVLSRSLIRCPSVTPEDAGAQGVLADALSAVGFAVSRLTFGGGDAPAIANLVATCGAGRPHFCFAGHTDVVPPGDGAAWTVDPFAAELRDGRLYGRGAADMKTAIACFAAAAERFLARRGSGFAGTVSLLVTGDEEGPARHGTAAVLPWLAERGLTPDACLVGEPTSRVALGEAVKIGRRGSLNAVLTVFGTQGHAAYPERADNPLPRLVAMLADFEDGALDDGTPRFAPSRLSLTSIDVGNAVTNLIPGRAEARFNVRFNDLHTAGGLVRLLERRLAAHGSRFELVTECSGEAFLCPPGPLVDTVVAAAERVLGRRPSLDTGGGTSDARFIKDYCPVVEFGMPGETAHRTDEHVEVADVERLTAVYGEVLDGFFAAGG
jgi:succinyl-diaminopimelate desuccinylase